MRLPIERPFLRIPNLLLSLLDLSQSPGVGVAVVPVDEVVVVFLSVGELDLDFEVDTGIVEVVIDARALVVFESVCLHALILSDETAPGKSRGGCTDRRIAQLPRSRKLSAY